MDQPILNEITVEFADNSHPVTVEFAKPESPIVIEFADELAANAALKEAIAADRKVVEDNMTLVNKAITNAEEVVESLQTVTEKTDQVNQQTQQNQQWHTEIKDWHDAHDADKAAFTELRDDMVQKEVSYQATVDAVDMDIAAATQAKTDAEQAKVATEEAQTATGQAKAATEQIKTDTQNLHDAVETWHGEVQADKQAINNAAASHLTSLQTKGDETVSQITTEGDTQVARVTAQGDQKISDATAQATIATNAASSAQTKLDDITAKHSQIDTWQSEVSSNQQQVASDTAAAKTARDQAITAAASMTGSIVDGGQWDASGNTLPAQPDNSTHWKITAAGTLDGIQFGVGDTLVFTTSDNSFYKIDNTEAVTSVNGQQGVVVIDHEDVGALPASTSVGDLGGYNKTEVDQKIDSKDSLPDQAGNAGKALFTDGTTSRWQDVPNPDLTPLENRIAALEALLEGVTRTGDNDTAVTVFEGEVQAKDFSIGNE